ncbi:group II trans-sialidase superfamily [Trypanosoma rangeli]|uniref:Group II trans-sialidase superfamily n=1 Tax=Trypanosoma rangeli TaxID=5698 RepID=A0A3R7KJE9_TRYRA|nr:group II trans-sialidase superfamily [Trypanosoma rangeli]RNE95677.1 group II trans-sialidase superfamily [Trypanosoma rangeli]|eukprot:RNE95677.1 group II trans-sialidase superfamily [Trypanosoma rangeli]
MSEQRHMLNMPLHMFSYSALLLFLLLICFASTAVHAEEKSTPKDVQPAKDANLFVPRRSIVETQGQTRAWKYLVSPSLASAGGVLVAFAKSYTMLAYPTYGPNWPMSYDVVAGYIDPAENWSSFVDEVRLNTWKTYSIFRTALLEEHNNGVRYAYAPTTIAKGNRIFILVGGYNQKYDASSKRWIAPSRGFDFFVGEVTQDKVIQWGEPTSLLPQMEPFAKQRGVEQFVGSGGPGVVMEDGTLVFPVTVMKTREKYFLSMIIYSKDDGKNWLLSQGMLPPRCTDPLIVEWEQGQLLMIVQRYLLSRVYESRDMGATWRRAVRILTRVQPRFISHMFPTDAGVKALITATIAGKKLMLYTQKGILPEEMMANMLCIWATDNNRTFHVGCISRDRKDGLGSDNTLLYSKNTLHLLQARSDHTASSMLFTSLPEQLKTITSVLETWAKMDSFLSNSSVPTAGLVGFLSDASGEGTWNDAYRCVNATVRNAEKVENGFKFTGFGSYAMWPVNMWKHRNVHGFVDYEFTLVVTVTINEVPNRGFSLVHASLGEGEITTFVGLSYTMKKRWGTVFNGITRITRNSTWEPGKEYQVALMLQGNEGSVYVDGVLVESSDTLPTLKSRRQDISHFYFGGGKNSSVTIKNVFLYNRQLSKQELKTVDDSHATE